MIHFVGAGPGAPDLITVRGKQYLEEADVIIYAGSLVNPQLLEYSKDVCTIYNSAKMTLEEVISVMEKAEKEGKTTVRLHTGDPCIYGAIREQMDILDEKGIAYDSCPGVSSFSDRTCGRINQKNIQRRKQMIHFVGAGPGAPDLITVRGKQYLEEADVIIYAGSLVNPQLLEYSKDVCTIYNSAKMTLEEVISVMEKAEKEGKTTVRLHTGDPCIYGAIREQMDILDEKGIAYDSCPGVSSFCGAASALNLEYTLPEISQSVIITRMEGRTPVPSKESIQSFAAHQASMVIFLSTGMLEELSRRLIEGGYREDTPAAIVYKATWPDEKKFICTVGTLAKTAADNNITKTALMIIGDAVNAADYDRSKLYDPSFTTEFRKATK